MNRKSRIIFCIVAIIVISISLIGFTYGYYYTNIIGNTSEKSVSVTLANLELTFDNGTGNIEAYNIVPGETIVSKTFSVENTGTFDISNYVVYLDEVTNSFVNKEDIVLTLTCTTDNGNCNGTKLVYPDNGKILVVNDIEVGVTHNYNVEIEYIETYEDQSIDKNKSFTGNIVIKDIRETDNKIATATGTNYVKLDNALGIKNYRIYGNSVQNGTPTLETPVEIESVGDKSANLFDPSVAANKIVNNTYYGIDLSNISGEFGVKIKLKDGKTVPKVNFGLVYIYSTGTTPSAIWFTQNTSSELKKVFASKPSNQVSSIGLGVYPATLDNWNAVLDAYDINIVEGNYTETTMPDYVPYGKYEIPVFLSGKNVFNINNIDSIKTTTTSWYSMEVENNELHISGNKYQCVSNKTLSQLAPSLNVGDVATFSFNSTSDNKYIYLYPSNTTWSSGKTMVITQDMLDSTVSFYNNQNIETTNDIIISNIQIEKNSVATSYEPYQKPINKSIYLDEPLRCIDNTNLDNCDYIDFASGSLVRRNTKLVMNGGESWWAYSKANTYGIGQTGTANSDIIMSNYFVPSKTSPAYLSVSGTFTNRYDTLYFVNANTTTLSDWKSWLTSLNSSGKPMEVYYKSASDNSEIIDLPIIPNNSYISVDSSISPSNITVDYFS